MTVSRNDRGEVGDIAFALVLSLPQPAENLGVPDTSDPGASQYPRRQAVLQADGSAVAVTIPGHGYECRRRRTGR